MSCDSFGFSERPFEMTPDPKFLYMSSANQDILTSLLGRIRERRGFTLVIGAVGIGKTTLLNALLDLLDVKVKVSVVFNIGGTFEELLHMILIDLGLADFKGTLSRVEAFERLKSFAIRQFANGGNVVLIVDEAQNLDNRSMENLRLLSNLETRKHKLIQIILCGQPDLEKKLRQPALRHLAQRITVKRHLCPLNKTETYKYLDHRLAVAGYTGSPLFNPKAREMVWKYSEGIPLNINRICHNALAVASALGEKRINRHIIDGVIEEIGWSPLPGTARPPPVNTSEKHHSNTTSITSYPLLAAVSLLSLSVGFVLGGPHFRDQYLGNLGTEISSRYKSFVARIIADPSHHETPAPSESLVIKAQAGPSKEPALVRGFPLDNADPPQRIKARRKSSRALEKASDENATPNREKVDITKSRGTLPEAIKETADREVTPAKNPKSSVMPPGPSDKGDRYSTRVVLQVGAFLNKPVAEEFILRLQEKGYGAYIEERSLKDNKTLYRVRINSFKEIEGAIPTLNSLKLDGFDAFPVHS